MRTVVNIVVLFMLAFIVAAVSWHDRASGDEESRVLGTHRAVRRVEGEVKYRAVTEQAELNEYGWPGVVEATWFGITPPQNHTVPADRPWLEIARGMDETQIHPTLLVSTTKEIPAFWYNPANGVVRARVGPMLSDRKALEMYNAINGCSLSSLFAPLEQARARSVREEVTREAAPSNKSEPVINVRMNDG